MTYEEKLIWLSKQANSTVTPRRIQDVINSLTLYETPLSLFFTPEEMADIFIDLIKKYQGNQHES